MPGGVYSSRRSPRPMHPACRLGVTLISIRCPLLGRGVWRPGLHYSDPMAFLSCEELAGESSDTPAPGCLGGPSASSAPPHTQAPGPQLTGTEPV